ncbi:MAG TPA: TlpA disulfide reductase family protein [Candidatus Angelobacter sp.]|jgi:peroxiredoxin|nr:TlpA disulfide reductase family protein [Candidatus Angelobacter sp.]
MTRVTIQQIIIIALIIGVCLLIAHNNQLSDELRIANQSIAKLASGALHEGGKPTPEMFPPLSVIKSADAPSPASGEPGEGAKCKECETKPNFAERESFTARMTDSPARSLLDLKRRYILGEPNTEFTLFVFFSPTDCPACLKEALFWEKLFKERQNLRLTVIGIVNRCSRKEAEGARQHLGISFPVLFDQNGDLQRIFRIPQTPLKVLQDNGGKVLLTDFPNQFEKDQIQFARAVEAKCKPKKI